MPKPRKLILCLLVLPFVLLLNPTAAMGQERCIVPTVTGEVKDIESWLELQCDPANPEEIDRNSSATIGVIGGAPPYYWEVAGKGFSMTPVTMVPTNKLYADSTACGFADITVTEAHGEQVACDVKCTSGQWGSWYTVDVVNTWSECGFGCKSAGGTWRSVCGGISQIYRWRRYMNVSHSCTQDCPEEHCQVCGLCYGTVSDGICTYTYECEPFCWEPVCGITLQRSDWGCGE